MLTFSPFVAKAASHNASTPPARNLMGPAQSTQTNSCKFDGASPTPPAKSISTATERPLNGALSQGLVSKDAVERREPIGWIQRSTLRKVSMKVRGRPSIFPIESEHLELRHLEACIEILGVFSCSSASLPSLSCVGNGFYLFLSCALAGPTRL